MDLPPARASHSTQRLLLRGKNLRNPTRKSQLRGMPVQHVAECGLQSRQGGFPVLASPTGEQSLARTHQHRPFQFGSDDRTTPTPEASCQQSCLRPAASQIIDVFEPTSPEINSASVSLFY